MELTLINVPQSTIEAIRNHKSKTGETLDPEELTRVASEAIENLLSGEEPLYHEAKSAFPLTVRESTSRLLEGYSSIAGVNKIEAIGEITDIVSDLIEKVLKEKIAAKLGLDTIAPKPKIVKRQSLENFTDTTGISTGLGDIDEETIEGEIDPNAGVPSEGGLSEEELNHEMDVENPSVESKGVASGDMDENQFAVAIGGKPYIDQRVAKRKKRPSKSNGKVSIVGDAGEAERNSF